MIGKCVRSDSCDCEVGVVTLVIGKLVRVITIIVMRVG